METDPGIERGAVIARVLSGWETPPHVERLIFGSADPEPIATAVERFCRAHLGAGVDRYEFFSTSVGSTHGLRLSDGRRVVVQAHPPDVADPSHLAAVQRVQRHLATAGFPCPEPLLGPTPLARGVAVVESLLDRGERADAHRPAVRERMATTLAELIRICRPFAGLPGLRSPVGGLPPDRLWPVPHDRRFDFEGTARGAEWIDRLAAEARRRLRRGAGDVVVGHGDWRAEHLRFLGGEVSAVYDWDSLAAEPEPVLVGGAAHAFTTDWSAGGDGSRTSAEECLAFLADYEAARGEAFSTAERRALDAALVYALAYTARCEHSDAGTGFDRRAEAHGPAPPGTVRAVLRELGPKLVDADGAR